MHSAHLVWSSDSHGVWHRTGVCDDVMNETKLCLVGAWCDMDPTSETALQGNFPDPLVLFPPISGRNADMEMLSDPA